MIMPNIAAIIASGPAHRVLHPGQVDAEREDRHGRRAGHLLRPPVLIAHRRPDGVRRPRRCRGRLRRPSVIMATHIVRFSATSRTGSPMFLRAMIMARWTAWLMKQVDSLWAGKMARLRDARRQLLRRHPRRPDGDRRHVPKRRRCCGSSTASVRPSTGWSTTTCCPSRRSSSSRRRSCSSTTRSTTGPDLLGIEQAQQSGKSVLFCSRPTPPGLRPADGHTVFGKGWPRPRPPGQRSSSSSAAIHGSTSPRADEPRPILAMIAGGMTQIFINVTFDSGLRAPAALARSSRSTPRPRGQPPRRHALGHRRRRRVVHDRVDPAAHGQGRHRGGRPDRRHGASCRA